MSKIKTKGKIIVWVLFGLILFYNLYAYTCIHIFKKQYVSIFGYIMLEVESGSMEPTINVGDVIIVNTKDKNVQTGEIITFKDELGIFVTHRISKIANEGIITKGDANNTEDSGYLSSKQIVGTYVFKISRLGSIIKFFKKPIVFFCILFIGIVICILTSFNPKDVSFSMSEEEKEYWKNKKKGD